MNIKQHKYVYANRFINYQLSIFNHKCEAKRNYSFPEAKPTVLQKSQFLTRYTYTGREYNRETGQYYYRARTYASRLGRFTGKDLLKPKFGDFKEEENLMNLYIYVFNKPMMFTDCSGFKSISSILIDIAKKILKVKGGIIKNDGNITRTIAVGKQFGSSCLAQLKPSESSSKYYGDETDADFVFTKKGWVKVEDGGKLTINKDGSYSCEPPEKCYPAEGDDLEYVMSLDSCK